MEHWNVALHNNKKADIKADSPKPDFTWKYTTYKKFIYMNQTGCFSHVSSNKNQYLMVMVEVDSNLADSEPIKNRFLQEIMHVVET